MAIPAQATVKFSRSGTDVVVAAPQVGSGRQQEKAQALGQTASGTYYAYDKGHTTYRATLDFELTETQKDALMTFFNTTTTGVVNVFDYVDQKGVLYSSCRLADTTLDITKLASQRWRIALTMLTAALMD